jgi:hypothetical protein
MMDLPTSFTPNTDERRKTGFAGFGGRKDSDSEEDEPKPISRIPGAAIAPPPSLQESFVSSPGPQQSSGIGMGMGVAAKIMAKYGFKVIKFNFLRNKIQHQIPTIILKLIFLPFFSPPFPFELKIVYTVKFRFNELQGTKFFFLVIIEIFFVLVFVVMGIYYNTLINSYELNPLCST